MLYSSRYSFMFRTLKPDLRIEVVEVSKMALFQMAIQSHALAKGDQVFIIKFQVRPDMKWSDVMDLKIINPTAPLACRFFL